MVGLHGFLGTAGSIPQRLFSARNQTDHTQVMPPCPPTATLPDKAETSPINDDCQLDRLSLRPIYTQGDHYEIQDIARLGAFAVATTAHARPDTRSMSCAQAQDLVKRQSAIVLSTGQMTYSRFVAHRGHCFHAEITRPQFAPTRDQHQCFVGYRCAKNYSRGNQ